MDLLQISIVIAEIIIIASLYETSPVINYSNKNTLLKKPKNPEKGLAFPIKTVRI